MYLKRGKSIEERGISNEDFLLIAVFYSKIEGLIVLIE